MDIDENKASYMESYCRGRSITKTSYFPHERFVQHAERLPDALAIISEKASLTYRELDLLSNKLANRLKGLGVGANRVVAIQLERGPEIVASVLGVYKAGGACAFIEPGVPQQRLKNMVGLLKPLCVITAEKYLGNYEEGGIPVILGDEPGQLAGEAPDTSLSVKLTCDDTAQIFFTSGTEGVPKAVVFPFGWYAHGDQPAPMTEKHLLKTDSGTTFTRAEILRPLTRGQQLYIAPPGLETNSRHLAEFIARHDLTHLICTPTALRELLATEAIKACTALRSVTCSGERISPYVKREFLSRLNAELFISYGCTEVPGAASYVLTRQGDPELDTVGRVAPMMEAYVLDEGMQPVSAGEDGEIYLGGLMAKGYLHDPVLTRQKFIAHPFSGEKDARVFKTGDRGRWLEGGFLKVLGRSDGQIKINSFRVETAEVETAILGLPYVKQAAVGVQSGGSGHKRLVAYLTVNSEAVTSGDIRMALNDMLPSYMIPGSIVLLSHLPLTSSGKIDRSALASKNIVHRAPRVKSRKADDCEKQLIAIWRSLLDVDLKSIDVRDNFFDLGGTSLLAAQMVDQVERFFATKLPLDTVWYKGGTIESLALLIRDQVPADERRSFVKIKDGSRQPLFVVHVRRGHLSDYYHLARCLSPEQSVIGLQARGIFNEEPPDSSVSKMAAYCIENMKKVQQRGPYLIAGYSSGGTVAFEMARQLYEAGEEVAMLAMLDTFCTSIGNSRRWKRAFSRLVKGKTHPIRDAIYSVMMRCLKLESLLRFSNIHSAHKWALMNYLPRKYQQPVDIMITTNSIHRVDDQMLGWDPYLCGDRRIHRLTGTHVSLMKYPEVMTLAEVLQERIDEVLVRGNRI
ncbi:AMP-binding protein [Porticoccus sp.]|uniref:AMP-binding protein n=1 Tax=Porticoccus sp. TaxID=2024853 RepID=UPI003F6A16DA